VNAADHWARHGKEFSELQSANDYAAAANRFATTPPTGTLNFVRSNGDQLLYDPVSNTFAVRVPSGAQRTMFKPEAGYMYWLKQIDAMK
jgi:filamentous hemagglutinin